MVDPYLDFIRQTLNQYPRFRATRIYQMAHDRGYAGSGHNRNTAQKVTLQGKSAADPLKGVLEIDLSQVAVYCSPR